MRLRRRGRQLRGDRRRDRPDLRTDRDRRRRDPGGGRNGHQRGRIRDRGVGSDRDRDEPGKRDPGAHDQLAAGAVRDRPAGADAARVPRDLELQPRLVRVPMGPLPGAGCTDIAGANGETYTLTAADVGQTVAVFETAVNGGGAGNPAASARSAVVKATSAVSLVVSPAPLVAGQRATLIATISSGSGNARPSGSVVFLNGLRAIPGCGAQPVSAGGQTATVVCQASFAAGAARFVAAYQPAAGAAVTTFDERRPERRGGQGLDLGLAAGLQAGPAPQARDPDRDRDLAAGERRTVDADRRGRVPRRRSVDPRLCRARDPRLDRDLLGRSTGRPDVIASPRATPATRTSAAPCRRRG